MPIEIIPDDIVSELIVLSIIGGIGWLSRMYLCIRKQEKRSWRQSQAIALIAQAEDENMAEYHPKKKGSLYTAVDRMLKDDSGNY